MSVIAHSKQPGQVYIVDRDARGKLRNFGAMVSIEGHMCICIGYTPDRSQAVFAPLGQLKQIRGAVRAAESKVLYRLLKRIMARYETSPAV